MSLLSWHGGPIDLKWEIATLLVEPDVGLWHDGNEGALWDDALWAPESLDWEDITRRIENCKIDRGRQRLFDRYRAGTMSVKARNHDGFFNPLAGVTPLGSVRWRPGRIIRLRAIVEGQDYMLFTGRVTSSPGHFEYGGKKAYVTITAVDALRDLQSNNPLSTTATGVQSTSDRVDTALTLAGWPIEQRDIQTGLHTMKDSELLGTTLEECQRAADAEGGALFADTENNIVFKARDWLREDERSTTVQAYLGYSEIQDAGVPHAHLTNVTEDWDLARIQNDIQVGRGGVDADAIRVFDAISIFQNSTQTWRYFDYQNTSDDEILLLAQRRLAALKDVRLRIDSAHLHPREDAHDYWRPFVDTQFGDLINLKVTGGKGLSQWSYENYLTHVQGLHYTITPSKLDLSLSLDDSEIATAELDDSPGDSF